MPDYNLTGLSPRSFEQLVQAIVLKEIGSQTIIFGDGTDGGREAAYSGKTHYPNEADAWDGYIVFQAKFRQRPSNNLKQDGDWAVAQLKKELEDFVDSQKGRETPEYYIFATNVILTPTLDKGSKDKMYQLFEDYKDTVPIKDYDIWDYDKIARFLDDNPGIRQTYAAWITSGDVLAEVIKAINFNRPDFESVIGNFLQKELLSDLDANLEQAGNSKDDRIPLASVFVDLPFASRRILEAPQQEEDSFIVAQLIESARHKLDPKFLRDNFPTKPGTQWTETIQEINSSKWVVIGGPGQGKTTVGQFLCQLFRVAILKDKTNINDIDVRRAINNFESQCQKETIALPTVRRFPIRIVLNDFAAKLASDKEPINSLLDYITYLIRKRTSREIAVDDLRQWLANYPWLIIWDGLDEVPASSNRNEVLTAIRDFWIDANDVNADMMVVATTRPQGYNEDFDTDLYNHVWLTPLSSKQALHYASRLVELRYDNDPNRREIIDSRLKIAAQDDSTIRLMQSPLQVTIMTVLCDLFGQPPKERWRLFSAYYQVIYQREVQRNIPASSLLREYKSDIDSIHYQMGLILQVESERSGKTDARLSVEDFTTLVCNRLEAEGHEGQECEDLTQQIIEAAANRLVFLVGLEQDIVGFEIRSLQEFMASEAIMNGSDSQIQERLEEIIPIISWRNVVLFAIGKCFTERQYLRDTIHSSCAALNDLDDLYNATLAGSRLALDILEDDAVAKQPKYLKLFTRLALNLLDLPPDNFHIQLADVYTGSLESIYKEEIIKRISNQNYQQSLGAWTCLLQLITLGFDWAIKLAERYWLQREEENLLIVAAFIKQHNSLKLSDDNWIYRTIVYLLPKLDPLLVEELISWEKIKQVLNFQCKWAELFLSLQKFSNFKEEKLADQIGVLFNEIDIHFDRLPRDRIFTLSFKSVFRLENIDIDKLKNNQNYSNSWNIYIAIAEFIDRPSELTLSNSLKVIAQESNSKLTQILDNIHVPWHIGECLEFAENSDELLQITVRAENGELGNYHSWQQAEERWRKNGITDNDLICSDETDLPYTANIAQVGYPLETTSMSITIYGTEALNNDYTNSYLPTLQELLKIRNYSNDGRVKDKISKYIISIFEVCPNIIKNTDTLQIFAVVKSLLADPKKSSRANKFFIISFVYIALIINIEYQPIGFNLINTYGELMKVRSSNYKLAAISIRNLNLVEKIIYKFNNNPHLLGFLRIISFLDVSKLGINATLIKVNLSLLEPQKYDNSEYKAAAIIVSLYRETWFDDDINKIVNCAINLIEEHPRIITRILDAIEEKHLPQDVCEKLLYQLKNKISTSKWQQLTRINKLMNEQSATRISSLGNKNKWSDLGLPPGASSLLPE